MDQYFQVTMPKRSHRQFTNIDVRDVVYSAKSLNGEVVFGMPGFPLASVFEKVGTSDRAYVKLLEDRITALEALVQNKLTSQQCLHCAVKECADVNFLICEDCGEMLSINS